MNKSEKDGEDVHLLSRNLMHGSIWKCIFNAIYLIPAFCFTLYGIPLDVIVGMGTAINPAITSVCDAGAVLPLRR